MSYSEWYLNTQENYNIAPRFTWQNTIKLGSSNITDYDNVLVMLKENNDPNYLKNKLVNFKSIVFDSLDVSYELEKLTNPQLNNEFIKFSNLDFRMINTIYFDDLDLLNAFLKSKNWDKNKIIDYLIYNKYRPYQKQNLTFNGNLLDFSYLNTLGELLDYGEYERSKRHIVVVLDNKCKIKLNERDNTEILIANHNLVENLNCIDSNTFNGDIWLIYNRGSGDLKHSFTLINNQKAFCIKTQTTKFHYHFASC